MVSSVAINSMVIRNMQSVKRIEASNRAYFAAEAGIEDALYELTPHFAGYETPNLNGEDEGFIRSSDFGGNVAWENKWQIESHSDENTWGTLLNPDQPLKLYPNQKLMIYLFNDVNDVDFDATLQNAINTADPSISALNVSTDFSIKFSIPGGETTITGGTSLKIDNDGDFDVFGVNEDPEGLCPGAGTDPATINTDCDGDGKVNEDSDEDPVILWRLTDGEGRSLIPIKGCLEPPVTGSEFCEIRFSSSNDYSGTLNSTAIGRNQDGIDQTIKKFINDTINGDPPLVTANPDAKLHFEFLIIAPMEHIDKSAGKKIEIPYIEYEVSSILTDELPYPFFSIKSDGYYGNFKQSITTIVTPKTTVPLFDFTIIQQQ